MMKYKLASTEWTSKTTENYRIHLEGYTFDIWGERPIDSFQPQEIRDLIMISMKDKTDAHKKNVLKFIRAGFAFASDRGYIRGSPVPTIKLKPSEKLTTVLTAPEMGILLNRAKELEHPWYEVWVCACYLGMRSGELYALRWDKVDFERNQIRVDQAYNSEDGFKGTKSNEDRWVKIAPGLLPILLEMKLKANGDPFVLPRFPQWEKGEQARILRDFILGIGLPRIRFHDLRAFWATLLLNNGVEPIKVMKLGGWKDMASFQLYIRFSAVDLADTVDKLILHNPSREVAEVVSLDSRR
ncbi:MAG: site-specific integrase [Proteobacteria bacterium]|nr:MAG: site-specific integrase [Pseudomonadota bacterium]